MNTMMKKLTAIAIAAAMTISAGTGIKAEAHALDDSAYTQIEGTMMYVSPDAAENTAVHVREYLSIPQGILASLTADNCKVYLETMAEQGGYYVTAKGVAAGVNYGNAYRVSGRDRRQILAITRTNYIDVLSDYDLKDNQTMLHEVGHYVDHNAFGGWETNGDYFVGSSTERWQALHAACAGTIGALSPESAVNVYNAQEMFATSFAWYVDDPQVLRNACPDVYTYMEEVVASF